MLSVAKSYDQASAATQRAQYNGPQFWWATCNGQDNIGARAPIQIQCCIARQKSRPHLLQFWTGVHANFYIVSASSSRPTVLDTGPVKCIRINSMPAPPYSYQTYRLRARTIVKQSNATSFNGFNLVFPCELYTKVYKLVHCHIAAVYTSMSAHKNASVIQMIFYDTVCCATQSVARQSILDKETSRRSNMA